MLTNKLSDVEEALNVRNDAEEERHALKRCKICNKIAAGKDASWLKSTGCCFACYMKRQNAIDAAKKAAAEGAH